MSFSKSSKQETRPPCALPSEDPSESFWHSEPSPLLTAHRTTRELPKSADVVIIGSGMTGASVAHHLLNADSDSSSIEKKDYNVVMLEAREACWGATGRNGGHCQPVLFAHPHDPSIGHFELENFRTIQSIIEAKKIDCEFVVQPGVRTFYSRRLWNEIELAVLTVQETAPKLAEMMTLVTDKAELAKLRVPTAIGAVVTKIAARMWPYKFVSRILEDLIMSPDTNGTFNLQTSTTVSSLTENITDGAAGWIVNTSRGIIKASKVVLATNAYTSHLLPNFSDLIVPVRGQMSSLVPFRSVKENNRLKTSFGFDGEAIDEYLIQRPNETDPLLMYGGGRQIGGATVGVADDHAVDIEIAKYLRKSLIERLDLPERYNKDTSREVTPCDYCKRQKIRCNRASNMEFCGNCLRFRQKVCTSWHLPPPPTELLATHQWTGIMGYSRDELPWVGPVPGKPNLYISAGYTGHGMPNTWLCGKAVAEMIEMKFSLPDMPVFDDTASAWNPIMESVRQNFLQIACNVRGLPPSEVVTTADTASVRAKKVESMYKQFGKIACKEFGLPESYLVTPQRLKKAMEEHEDVGAVDWAEMERARRKQRTDRMPSGYA